MAVTSKRAGTHILDENAGAIFDSDSSDKFKGTTFKVENAAASSHNAEVNVPALHGDEYIPIAPGGKEYFRVAMRGITRVNAKTPAGGAATIYAGFVALE